MPQKRYTTAANSPQEKTTKLTETGGVERREGTALKKIEKSHRKLYPPLLEVNHGHPYDHRSGQVHEVRQSGPEKDVFKRPQLLEGTGNRRQIMQGVGVQALKYHLQRRGALTSFRPNRTLRRGTLLVKNKISCLYR